MLATEPTKTARAAPIPGLVLVLVLAAACPRSGSEGEEGAPTGAGSTRRAGEQAGERAAEPARPPILVVDISFAGPGGHRADAVFARGEKVTCLFSAANFTYERHRAHIVADVEVRRNDGVVVLRQSNLELVKGKAPSLRPGTLRSMAALEVPPAAGAGRFAVVLTVRDLLGKRKGTGKGAFTIAGEPSKSSKLFAIQRSRLAADRRVPPGAVVPVSVEVAGFATRRGDDGHRVHLRAAGELLADGGEVVHRFEERAMVNRSYPFAPQAHPAEVQLVLPAGLPAASYELRLRVIDKLAGPEASAEATLPLQVMAPPGLAVVNPHVHDAAGLTRASFLLGEQIFVRLSVYGLATRAGRAAAAVDLAVSGPDNGVYFASKDAARVEGEASEAVVKAGRFPTQLPLILPSLAPRGVYRLVLRARDLLAGKEVIREHEIRLRGQAPPPLGSFSIDQLEVRQRPDLPPIKGDTFQAGRTYILTPRVGGMKLTQVKKVIHSVQLEGDLRLSNLRGEQVHRSEGLFNFERTFTYLPLRIPLPAKWTVPTDLPGGLYDLQVRILNKDTDRVTHLSRRVEILPAPPAIPLP